MSRSPLEGNQPDMPITANGNTAVNNNNDPSRKIIKIEERELKNSKLPNQNKKKQASMRGKNKRKQQDREIT